MENNTEFYTFKGYELNNKTFLTNSMEDYLEMICRLIKNNDYVRINEIAEKLNVRPSSASKMVHNLKLLNMVEYEKYGYVKPTNKGLDYGKYLLYRHKILNEFLCYINNSENELEQVEKIEHFIDKRTIFNISKLLKKIKNNK